MATAVTETRRGFPPCGRGEGEAPSRGAPGRADGRRGDSERSGLALLLVVALLIRVFSRRVDVAGALHPAGGRELRSAGHGTGTEAVPGARRAARYGRLRPCQGHTATMALLERGHQGIQAPVGGGGGLGAAPRHPDCGTCQPPRSRGSRPPSCKGREAGQCPGTTLLAAHGNFPHSFPLAPALIRPVPPEFPEPVNEQHHKDDEEEDDDGREANEPRLQHLGGRACTAREGRRWEWGQLQGTSVLQGMGPPPSHEMGHWQTLTVPFPTVPCVPRKPPPTQLTCPQHSGEHWGSRWVSPDLSALPPKVTVGALRQTGPTEKVSQELI